MMLTGKVRANLGVHGTFEGVFSTKCFIRQLVSAVN